MRDLDFNLPDGAAFEWLVARPSAIVVIVAGGLLARWLVHRLINRLVTHAHTGAVPSILARGRTGELLADLRPAASERRVQRADTMGSLLKSIATGIVGAIVVLMIIDRLGYNIAPLIASAGIAGVAFGFGAQSLVKDFLAGIFMILEDQYGVGDVVDLGEAGGTVEAVGLRVTRLRDINGTVWYVRNGEVLRVGNMSQNWARSVLDITVGYEADLDVVQQILRDVARELFADPAFQGLVIGEPEVPGVERFDKDGPVVRVLIKTAPLKQWDVSRSMRERIKARFDAAGIRMPSTSYSTLSPEDTA